jgi:type I restriction enzyme R subunit
MHGWVEELARRSQNFGFLLRDEPLLVADGCTAESYIYSDPDAAMFNARRFGEVLARKVASLTRTPVRGDTQHARLQALTNAGVVAPRIHREFDQVRTTGNRAVHTYYGDVRAAVIAVRACFELGCWFHRMLEPDDREPRAFVPPPEPDAADGPGTAADPADQAELDELRRELAAYLARLADVKLHRDDSASRLESESRARAAVEQALRQAVADHEQMRGLAGQYSARVSELEAAFAAQVRTSRRVSAADRDVLVSRAQRAAAPPLTEAEVRGHVDQMLTAAGWSVQDAGHLNLYTSAGVAVREVATAAGVADYLLYVDRRLAGVIEAKREGRILTPVEHQSGRYVLL